MCNMSLLFCSVYIILFAVCSSHAKDSVELSEQSHDALVEKYNKIIQNLEAKNQKLEQELSKNKIIQNLEEKNQKLEQITEGLRTLCSSLNDLPKEGTVLTPVDSSINEHRIVLQAKTTRAETTADSILYAVEYESPSEPLVLWSKQTIMYHYEDIMSTKTDVITNEFDGKHGKTTLVTSNTQKLPMTVSFQTELDYIYLDLILPENNKSVSMEQVPPVEIEVLTDGKEVSYTVGDILTFNVTVSLADEANESSYRIQDPGWYFITTNQSSTPQSVVEITQHQDVSKNLSISVEKLIKTDTSTSKTYLYKMDTGKLDAGGILFFYVTTWSVKDSLITFVSESRGIILKQAEDAGPFPDRFVGFISNEDKSHQGCQKHDKCVITCTAVDTRTDPDPIQLVNQDGLMPEFPTIQKIVGYFHYSFFLVENMTRDKEGEYQCLTGTPVAASTQVTLIMREPVRILNTSGIVNQTKMSLTFKCGARGVPTPNLRVIKNGFENDLTKTDDDNIIVEKYSANHVTTTTITISNLDNSDYTKERINSITCEADNEFETQIEQYYVL